MSESLNLFSIRLRTLSRNNVRRKNGLPQTKWLQRVMLITLWKGMRASWSKSQSRWPYTHMYISLSSKWRLKLFSFSFYTKVLKLLKAVSSHQSHHIQFYTQFHFARWKLWPWRKTSNPKHNPHEFMTVSTITYTAHLWPQKNIINTW